MPVSQLVYRSTLRAGRIDSPLALLRDILKVSERNNRTVGITGFLVFDGQTFAQILEGEPADVERTFARIALDERHRDVTVVASQAVPQRDFASWTMGGCLRQGRDAAAFERHGIAGPIDASVSGPQIVALAKELVAARATG
jgi:hypothetical protein